MEVSISNQYFDSCANITSLLLTFFSLSFFADGKHWTDCVQGCMYICPPKERGNEEKKKITETALTFCEPLKLLFDLL